MLELHLSHNANLSLGDKSSKLISTKYIHRINMTEPTSIVKQIHFEIDGKPDLGFPEPIGLYLNGFDICNCTKQCFNKDDHDPMINNMYATKVSNSVTTSKACTK
ncbi:uncharacterized protein LOC129613404 [Condylostylus longicornis]|uniref:uncharacterized protein LOC129613404 n=1 Tax=Condylostylus longicornis TaxID=2530218 RepID=UPI00244DB288|nr:uncharacterized protein LOC129613404 [Condylostylus longicornis]